MARPCLNIALIFAIVTTIARGGDLQRLPPVESDHRNGSLEKFEQLALQNNPTMVIAHSRVEAARGRLIQSGLLPNTVIGYHATQINNFGTSGQQGGFVNQKFITGGKRKLDQSVAGQQLRRAELQFYAQRTRLLTDVRLRFWDAVIAQHRHAVARQLVHIADEAIQAQRQLLRSRLATRHEVLQAEIEAESTRVLYDNTINQRREAWQRLAIVVGQPKLPMKNINVDLDGIAGARSWRDDDILASSPELAAAHTNAQRAELAVVRAMRQRVPDVDVTVSVRHSTFTSSDVANVQVGIPVPYLDRNQGNIHRANAELAAARAEVKRIELALRDQMATSLKNYSNARQQSVRYSQRILPRAKESLRLVRRGYDSGQMDYLSLLTAQRTYFQANLEYLSSLRAMHQNAALIDGQLLSGSLQKLNQ